MSRMDVMRCPQLDNATNDAYAPLVTIYERALLQAAMGKGYERHANGQPWLAQPIMRDSADFGVGFPLGQASKKLKEAKGMADRHNIAAATRELLGAINYVAAAILHLEQTSTKVE